MIPAVEVDEEYRAKIAGDFATDGHPCPWCAGRGWQSVDGSSLAYACPDCAGAGVLRPVSEDSDD